VISLDFVTGSPLSTGFDSILVIIDYLTKMVQFVPTTFKASDVDVALFFLNIFRLHGLPKRVISDKYRCQYVWANLGCGTAYDTQTDGQAERLSHQLLPLGPQLFPLSNLLTILHLIQLPGKLHFCNSGKNPAHPLHCTLNLTLDHAPEVSLDFTTQLKAAWHDARNS